MKFLCSHCKAKYQIADEKVAGRTLRMVCRRCQQEIVIRGEAHPQPRAFDAGVQHLQPPPAMLSAPAPTPSPLGADFQRQIGAHLASPLPSVAAIDEWHVAINDTPVGPMRRDEVARKLAMGAVSGDSLAWREGMDDWMPLLQIPELAVLCMPRAALQQPAPPPQPFAQPAQRVEFSPMGGRAGAAPYTLDSWQPAPSWSPPEASQQIAVSPVVEMQQERRAQGPSWPAMFAVACGFALLMSALTIVGAGWLRDSPQTGVPGPVAATAGAAALAPAQPSAPAEPTAVAEVEPEGMVIGLDEVEDPSRPTTRPRSGAQGSNKNGGKKELTAAQREMLARMGGDTGTDLSGLNTGSGLGSQAKRPAGSLTAAEVSQVVQRGKKNLQRCYETAIRGTGSTDTMRLDVELMVSPSGNVAGVKIGGQGLPGMSNCIERTVKMWRFPASGEESPVKFPLLFQPGA